MHTHTLPENNVLWNLDLHVGKLDDKGQPLRVG